ncbi:hypothetical protein K443DRAFT_8177 [Laccaria amethystina LaAM-08-1]|uniref:Uncharacterized protein n=1 Tax=Laccaria amethystina LaAM-08-1 TaxID=1095629 RepID=A0A0C9XUY5_9AGAR|nr:hypothetical protein K443DRAFT_8177 [Laccaria amethystina LaAM-08-1]
MSPYFITYSQHASLNCWHFAWQPPTLLRHGNRKPSGDERRAQEVLELTESTAAKNDEGEGGDNEGLEGTGEDDDQMNEDASSSLSAGDHLVFDLECVLDGNFEFTGSYACGQTMPGPPNPCLTIAGMGLVGLPLNKRDARQIIACSSRAPYGHGESTVVNANVRDTWEIEPAKIKFDSPAWAQYVQDLSVNVVRKALGVSQKAPRCELYKLLLYEVGSYFLPHTDTEKSGHVRDDDYHPTICIHRRPMKPVTSGYRLALSYNIIHTAPDIPRPTLPDTYAFVTDLHRILRKWRQDLYENTPDDNMAAYLLAHHYSSKNLASGMSALKASDAHKVAHLNPIAEEQGFLVCLTNLEYMVSEVVDVDYDQQMWKRKRFDCDEDEDECEPFIEEVLESSLTLKNLFDLQGYSLRGLMRATSVLVHLFHEILLRMWNLMIGRMRDTLAAGTLDYWYRRTVLILIHESNAGHALFSTGGIHYALEELRGSETEPTPPTENNKRLAALVVKYVSSRDKGTLTSMFNLALRWKDSKLWSSQLVKAWKTFGFVDTVQNGYRHLLVQTKRLSTCLDFIQALPAYAPVHETEAVLNWCQKETDRAMTTYYSADVEDDRILFHRVLKSDGEIKRKFQTLFIPLIKPLRELLNKEGVELTSGPFHDLFHLLIGSYLQNILGAKPRLTERTKLRKIGCGCADCGNVDTFLFSTELAELTLRLVKARRLHVQSRLNATFDLLTYQVIRGSPYRLHITKTAETVEVVRWSARQADMRSLLKEEVGEDDVLQKVMGMWWDDVRKALQGTESFKLAQVAPVRNPPDPQVVLHLRHLRLPHDISK